MFKLVSGTRRWISAEVMKAHQMIESNVKSKDITAYMTGKYLPEEIRSSFYTINYFNTELMKVSENTREKALGLGKLQFWNEIIDKIYKLQNPNLEPISIALNHACQSNPLTKLHFKRMIEARHFQITNPSLGTMDELFQLAEKSRTSLILLTVQLLRIPVNDDIIKLAIQVGGAVGVCEYIRKIPYNLRNYRLYLPESINNKHNINVKNLWDRIHGKPREELFDAVLEVAAFAKQALNKAKQMSGCLPKQGFRAFLTAVDAELYLENLQKVNFNVFSNQINSKLNLMTYPYRLFKSAREGRFYYKN